LRDGLYRLIAWDIVRAGGPKQFGVSLHLMAFFWIMGWIPVVAGIILLTVTWMSFSTKDVMVRPVATGNTTLYLALVIPMAVSGLICALVGAISHKIYLISVRVMMGIWSLLFFITMGCCIYYGYKTIKQLAKTNDSFARKQQFRVYVIMCIICIIGGAGLGVQSYFLEKIDSSPHWYFIVLTAYRLCELTLFVGCALYVWFGTVQVKRRIGNSNRTATGHLSSAVAPNTIQDSNDDSSDDCAEEETTTSPKDEAYDPC
jgi:hypothetical protein